MAAATAAAASTVGSGDTAIKSSISATQSTLRTISNSRLQHVNRSAHVAGCRTTCRRCHSMSSREMAVIGCSSCPQGHAHAHIMDARSIHGTTHPSSAHPASSSLSSRTSLYSLHNGRQIARRSGLQREGLRKKNVRVCASAAASTAGGDGGDIAPAIANVPLPEKIVQFQQAFWKFLRPHTIRGTVLGTSALTIRALLENPQAINWSLLPRALLGLVALLCGNGYIVGINQIYDVSIDKISKPFLPVAAGELSPKAAWILCALLSACGVAITAANFGPLITSLYSLGLFLGTIYSVPPLRLKRFAIPAFLIIATVRGVLLNFGVYYATRAALQLPFQWSPAVAFITLFVTVFATVIAITKDLPDVEGDKANNIETFATRLGVETISRLGVGLLGLNYLGAVALAAYMPQAFNVPLVVGAHAIMAAFLLLQYQKLAEGMFKQVALANFYRNIWYLFYSEYALLPFM